MALLTAAETEGREAARSPFVSGMALLMSSGEKAEMLVLTFACIFIYEYL